jgi:hypothetical protein
MDRVLRSDGLASRMDEASETLPIRLEPNAANLAARAASDRRGSWRVATRLQFLEFFPVWSRFPGYAPVTEIECP